MRTSFDADLRALERAWSADPTDAAVGGRYVRALRRAGRSERAAGVLFRLGERVEACLALGIRWEADAPRTADGLANDPEAPQLYWNGEKLSAAKLLELVQDDLARFDPERLAASWPRRQDGGFRGNRALPLQRYQAHELGAPHRRLTLLAWTPGTSTLRFRPEDRGKPILTVSLETRSNRKKLLPAKSWQRSD